jgi:hypothetical protein
VKFETIKPRDSIAVLVIIGGMCLVALGIDKIIGGLLVMVVSFYFGLNLPKPKEN